ncbi:MAG: flavodoxin [Blautia sp.]
MADLFEIEPVEQYTDDDLDWSDDDSRVSREHDDESLRDVELTEVTPDDFKYVKTVII